jgi:hypothetical protein
MNVGTEMPLPLGCGFDMCANGVAQYDKIEYLLNKVMVQIHIQVTITI